MMASMAGPSDPVDMDWTRSVDGCTASSYTSEDVMVDTPAENDNAHDDEDDDDDDSYTNEDEDDNDDNDDDDDDVGAAIDEFYANEKKETPQPRMVPQHRTTTLLEEATSAVVDPVLRTIFQPHAITEFNNNHKQWTARTRDGLSPRAAAAAAALRRDAAYRGGLKDRKDMLVYEMCLEMGRAEAEAKRAREEAERAREEAERIRLIQEQAAALALNRDMHIYHTVHPPVTEHYRGHTHTMLQFLRQGGGGAIATGRDLLREVLRGFLASHEEEQEWGADNFDQLIHVVDLWVAHEGDAPLAAARHPSIALDETLDVYRARLEVILGATEGRGDEPAALRASLPNLGWFRSSPLRVERRHTDRSRPAMFRRHPLPTGDRRGRASRESRMNAEHTLVDGSQRVFAASSGMFGWLGDSLFAEPADGGPPLMAFASATAAPPAHAPQVTRHDQQRQFVELVLEILDVFAAEGDAAELAIPIRFLHSIVIGAHQLHDDGPRRRHAYTRMRREERIQEPVCGECVICTESEQQLVSSRRPRYSESFNTPPCSDGGHRYCKPCLATWIDKEVTEGKSTVRCLHVGCVLPLSTADVQRLASVETAARHRELAAADYRTKAVELLELEPWLRESTRQCPECGQLCVKVIRVSS